MEHKEYNLAKILYSGMSVENKREYYRCGVNFKTIDDILDWSKYSKTDEAKVVLESAKTDSDSAESPVTDKDDSESDGLTERSYTDEPTARIESSASSVTDKDDSENGGLTEKSTTDEATAEGKPDASCETGENSSKNDVLNESTKTDGEKMEEPVFLYDEILNQKISVFIGDITCLEIDAIVNAANDRLQCGGGVDAAIHNAAGAKYLSAECSALKGCEPGNAKITGGYKLPAKYVIHAVGPQYENSDLLSGCYEKSMDLLKEHKLETIAFPCISTGIYGYPNGNAADVALKTIRKWLEENEYGKSVKRVIFCLFLKIDVKVYHKLLPKYFPPHATA